jgi:DNA-binding response OmpR family regulator
MKSPDLMTREELEEEVLFLRSELGIALEETSIQALISALGLTRSPVRLLLALHGHQGKVASTLSLMEACAHYQHDREMKIVSLWVCRLRKALGHDAIENAWGKGYRLTSEGIAKVDQILEKA